MSEDPSTPNTPPVGDSGQPPAGDPSAPQDPPPAGDDSGEEMIPKSTLNEKNRENQSLRKRLKELETVQQKREDAEKTELEKANSRLEELEQQATRKTERLRKANVIQDVKVPNARYAWMAAQEAGIELEFDDDDRLTNADAVAKALKKHDPDLFGTGRADAGETGRQQVQNGDPKASFLAQQLGL